MLSLKHEGNVFLGKKVEEKYCIYFKKTEPEVEFKSGEHIFPAGIGGIQKLPVEYVSHNCNNSFSNMERKVMRESILAIPRQFNGPGKRGSLNPGKATKSKGSIMTSIGLDSLELGYVSLGMPHSILQLRVKVDGKCEFVADMHNGEIDKQVQDFLKELNKFDDKYVLIKESSVPKNEYILGFHEGKWHVVLSNEELRKGIKDFVGKVIEQNAFANLKYSTRSTKVKLQQHLEFSFDDFYRVSAKTVFNYLAFAKGRNFILKECFDPIRDWIVNGGENKFATLTKEKVDLKIPLPQNGHYLIIVKSKDILFAIVSFYGMVDVSVKLCEGFNEDFFFEGFVCDWENKKEYKFIDYINQVVS